MEEAEPQAAPKPNENAARTAGRGGLAIAVAKVSFIVFGFAQQLILERVLGQGGYGQISRVLAIVGVLNNVVVATAIQGVSRAISTAPEEDGPAAFARTLRIHAVIAVVLSTGFALAAGFIANQVGAPHIANTLRIVAAVVLLYGVYAPLVGSLNGRRRFLDQAGLDISYGLMRTILLGGGAFLFVRLGQNGSLGATLGFVGAAAFIVPIALFRAGIGKPGPGGPSIKDYLGFLAPLAVGQYFLNQLLQTDFMLLSRFAGQAGRSSADTDALMGVYRGVQLFAFLPYQMLMSVSFVLFPMLARARAERDEAAVKSYASAGIRVAFVITGLLAGVIASLAPQVLRFAFKAEAIHEQGGPVLRVLALGMGAFAILGISGTALTGLGRERISAFFNALAVALVAAGNMIFTPRAAFGPEMLMNTAIATSCAMVVMAVIAAVALYRDAHAFVSPLTLGRVALAVAGTVAFGSRLPWMGKLGVPVLAIAAAFVYLGVLVVSGELGKKDLLLVKKVLGKH